jgi:LmbE family N-acetylglucosaminyl deacetylase
VSETLLCIVTHPDDETMLTGGTLAMLVQRGVAVHILCATRGEGGEVGEPPVCARAELGRVRGAELRCAAAALGARSVAFLGYVDPDVGPDGQVRAFEADPAELEGRVVAAIRRLQPAVLLTHGSQGEYGHPGHILTHQAVMRAVRRSSLATRDSLAAVYTFCAAIPGRQDRIFNEADPAHVVLDVTPWLDVKSAAATCHRSQHGLFFRHHPEARTIREVLRTTESLHLAWSRDGCQSPLFAEWTLPDAPGCRETPR